MGFVQYAVVALVAALTTLALTPVVRIVGIRWGIVSHPGGRHVHKGVIPRIGGVAMFLGFTAAVLTEYLGERLWDWTPVLTRLGRPVIGVLIGIVAVFVIGMLDDIFDLRPGQKLLGQIAAAGIVIAFGVKISFISNPFGGGIILLGVLAYPITLFWIVGFANVINLIDGLDGLAAGVTAIASLSFLLLAVQSNVLVAGALAAALFGSCLGFLRYNFNPASVFMGDSGALFLGFTLACISLLGVIKSVAAITLVIPLLIIGVPIFDTLSAIIRRSRHGQPIQMADKGHIHHRLLGRGFNQRQTVLIIYVWSIALAFGGYATRWAPPVLRLLTLVALASLSGLMAHWLGLFEAAHHDDE
ncbi:MAG: undecaprenyl/decaprenyl-phosphate alpha-N-acetylglucosaminyl 1-phosphate transferase [Actinobacteria bacterium]|nr:MAG: undecaprenyl/decaprenyl-phosphate alpha-N-acetylglucosaminyl 1-phosphate transferase [Actinomycetota bacterium]